MIITSILFGGLAFAVVSLILCMISDDFFYTTIGRIIRIASGVSVAIGVFVGIVTGEKEAKASFDNGRTITSVVERVNCEKGTAYILTAHSETFLVHEKEYILLTPGDTLTYRLYDDGVKTKILSVKYKE